MHGRQVVWNIEHDVADYATDRGQRIWGDVLERVFVRGGIFELGVFSVVDIEGHAMPPVDLFCVSILD